MPVPEIVGPIVLNAVGEGYAKSTQIRAVLWEGVTTAGDTCELIENGSSRLLFAGRATGTQTWEGMMLPMSCPGGFQLTKLSAGRVIVYLAEPDAV